MNNAKPEFFKIEIFSIIIWKKWKYFHFHGDAIKSSYTEFFRYVRMLMKMQKYIAKLKKTQKKTHWKINSFSINHNWWSIKMCNKIFILNIVIIFHLWFIERNISITHSTVNSPFLNLNSKFIREKLNNYHQIKWNFSIFEQNLKEVWKNQINNVIRSISNIPLL